MIETFFTVCVGVLFLCIILLIIGGILFLNINEKHHLIIRLPKNKKYENKVDPIYELSDKSYMYDESDGYSYAIQKWSLKWNELECRIFLLIFLYPITIYRWGYSEDNYFYIGDKIKVEDLHKILLDKNMTLRDYYENEMDKIQKLDEIENMKENEFKTKIINLNKEFTENFE